MIQSIAVGLVAIFAAFARDLDRWRGRKRNLRVLMMGVASATDLREAAAEHSEQYFATIDHSSMQLQFSLIH